MGEEEEKVPVPVTRICPPSVMKMNTGRPRRPAMLKRTSSMGDERQDCETPSIGPGMTSGWPGAGTTQTFNFLGESGAGIAFGQGEKKPSMPDTPVKKSAYTAGGRPGMTHSTSQPTLGSSSSSDSPTKATLLETGKINLPMPSKGPPPTGRKPTHASRKSLGLATEVPYLTLTESFSPESGVMDMDGDPNSSPSTGRVLGGIGHPPVTRVGLLRRLSNGVDSSSEEEGTPTKGGGERLSLASEFRTASMRRS